MDRDTIIEVTQKLTGRCYPYGDTRIDEERYESLLLKIAVASSLIDEVYEAGKLYERHEYSIQNISNRANQCLTELRDTLCEIDHLPPTERTGEWVFRTDIPIGGGAESAGYVCSECKAAMFKTSNECPNCKAKMKGGTENE